MAYPEDYLHDEEQLVLHIHPHWWYMASSSATLALAVALGVLTLRADLHDWVQIIAAVAVVVTLVWFLERFLRWVSTHFVLTSDRVIYRSGIIAKSGIEIPLENINAIHFSQRIFERVLGLGDLRIDSASVEGVSVFQDIRKPDQVQNEIYLQMEANDKRRFSQGGTAATGMTVAEQIERLHGLRERGALSEEEYQAAKAQLLGAAPSPPPTDSAP